jgi:DNA-binding transcriptional ArsR family regulator
MARSYIVRDPRQLRALASPARQAIVDIVAANGPSSVREIAIRCGRPASALYHHVRMLRKVGLLTASNTSSTHGRPAVLLDVPGRPLAIRYLPDDRRTQLPMRKIVVAMTKAAARDFAQGYRPDVAVRGDKRRLWAARSQAWLTDAELRSLNRLLRQIVRRVQTSAHRPRVRARLHSLTFVLAPAAVTSG